MTTSYRSSLLDRPGWLLRALVPELRVLPWEGEQITIDFASRDGLDRAAAELDRRVAEVEREDPWVKREFGISGLGERLVLYPEPHDPALMFKAKSEKHRTAGTRSARPSRPPRARGSVGR